MSQPSTNTNATQHPLDPLSAAEMETVVAIIQAGDNFSAGMRFVSITLHEPPKEVVLSFKEGNSPEREAFVILLDRQSGLAYEVIVSLTRQIVTEFKPVPGVQPPIIFEEVFVVEETVKQHPEVQAALRRRGLTDLDLVAVEPWSAGNYGDEIEQNHRLCRALVWTRAEPDDNYYAHPVDGLIVLVDLNKMEVIRVEDHGVVPVPPEQSNYAAKYIPHFRQDLKKLDIVQPDGVSFEVNGYQVKWQKWSFRLGFTHREGLVLHQIGYEDQGRVRPIIYRASLAEMTVPYGDPSVTQYRKNAFDAGEYGLAIFANSLELGCDCLGAIHYFDAHLCLGADNIVTVKNAICMHEEDFSLLWKHVNYRTGEAEVRRSRRLVVSFIATIGNYEYAFYWYFYQDGTIQFEVKLTGIMTTAALSPGETTRYGTTLAPGLYAPNHQHFFCLRLDMAVDGPRNSVVEVNTVADPLGPDNPYGNAFYGQYTPLHTEQEAQRLIDPFAGRYWLITNPHSRNKRGQPVAYKLMPGDNILPFAQPESSIARRAGYMWKHLWVTPYRADEKYPAGPYPNQHPGGDGLPQWTQANRSIEDADLVVWYVMGSNHLPRLEDWPVMPVAVTGLTLKPSGFFNQNPALDVPPNLGDHCEH